MALPRAKHDAWTTLASQHTSGDGILAVAAAPSDVVLGRLPASVPYYVRAQAGATVVLFKVTSIAGSNLTVTVADGTTDATLAATVTAVALVVSGDAHTDMRTQALGHVHTGSDDSASIFDATNPTTIALGASAAPGTATIASHRDHTHGRTAYTAISAFGAVNNAVQAIATGTFTKVLLQTEQYDYLNEFASSRFTATADGMYSFSGGGIYTALAAGSRIIFMLYKNGVEILPRLVDISGVSLDCGASGSMIIPLVATDYIELYTFQTGAASQSLYANFSCLRGSRVH